MFEPICCSFIERSNLTKLASEQAEFVKEEHGDCDAPTTCVEEDARDDVGGCCVISFIDGTGKAFSLPV